MQVSLERIEDKGAKVRLKRLLLTALLLAVAVHVILGIGAGLWIVIKHFQPPEAVFVSRPSVSIPPEVIDPKHAAAEFDAAASRPVLDQKLASLREMDFALPDVPMADVATTSDFTPAPSVVGEVKGLLAGTGGSGGGAGGGGLSFFGAVAKGERVAFLFDTTWSGSGPVFEANRAEWLKTFSQMRTRKGAQFYLVYFSGCQGGHLGIPGHLNSGRDNPLRTDFRFPLGADHNWWVSAGSDNAEKIADQLKAIDPNGKVPYERGLSSPDRFFVRGTQFFGALNNALTLDPQPSMIFILIEANIAFPSVELVDRSFENYRKFNGAPLGAVPVHLILGNTRSNVQDMKALKHAVNLLNGGGLSDAEIDKQMTFAGK